MLISASFNSIPQGECSSPGALSDEIGMSGYIQGSGDPETVAQMVPEKRTLNPDGLS